jgi:hypothetical protein
MLNQESYYPRETLTIEGFHVSCWSSPEIFCWPSACPRLRLAPRVWFCTWQFVDVGSVALPVIDDESWVFLNVMHGADLRTSNFALLHS